jgi:hypothetical protein
LASIQQRMVVKLLKHITRDADTQPLGKQQNRTEAHSIQIITH